MEVVIASSLVDAGVGCWDLRSGAEQLRHHSCSSPPHGLVSVAGRFLAASQLRDSPSAASSPIFFWSWDKPQVAVKSFPAEPIGPLVSNSEGTYIIGGGLSGVIYLWELASGKLINRWNAHYQSVTCLTLSDDESLLISGSEDGCVRVWSLLMMFDDVADAGAGNSYRYSFSEHVLRVTDVVSGYGLCNSIVISSSEDRSCKIWSLSEGTLLRSISFPSAIDAIAMDPGEHTFFAGGRDGKIYIAVLNAECNPNSSYGMFILGALYDHSKAISCLASSMDGVTLVSGSEDGRIRMWDTKSQHVTRVIKHTKDDGCSSCKKMGKCYKLVSRQKCPVNNVLIVRQPRRSRSPALLNAQLPQSKKHLHLSVPPPLCKYTDSVDGEVETKAVTLLQAPWYDSLDSEYCSLYVMKNQIKELQQQSSSGAAEMELERLRVECKQSMKMVQQWKKLYRDLQNLCATELLNELQPGDS